MSTWCFCEKLRRKCGLFVEFCAENVDFLWNFAPKCGLFAGFCAFFLAPNDYLLYFIHKSYSRFDPFLRGGERI